MGVNHIECLGRQYFSWQTNPAKTASAWDNREL